MPHRNARLTVHGRRLLIDRVSSGRPIAHVAKEVGVSRQCAHRWVARYAAEGEAGLQDRSSRPQHSPKRTSPAVEAAVVAARRKYRRGPDWLAAELGVPARTVSRILRRHQLPYLADCDPLTGQLIRSSKQTACRYQRDRPGELVHMDVKKIGKIPDGGGWRAHGRPATEAEKIRRPKIGLRLPPLSRRRPLPARLLRDPDRRERHHLCGVPAPRRRPLRRPRDPAY